MKLHLKNLQKIALSLGIVIVLNLLFNAAIGAFYSAPKHEDFCRAEQRKYYDNKDACEAVGGEWGAYVDGPYYVPYYRGPVPAKIAPPPDGEKSGVDEPKEYCNPSKSCQKDYDSARNVYNRNVFVALVILGGLSLLAGILVIHVPAVAFGFLYGGLLSLFIGTTRYWSDMNEYLRFVVLAVVLTALVWVGYKKLRDK